MPRATGFDEYVATRSQVLLRFAYLLCGDRHLAEDLVQEVLVRAHRRWSAIESANPDAYLKQALVRTHVSWRRRRASAELATATFADVTSGRRFDDEHASREEMWALLAVLPPAQRAVLVLRYFEDLDDRRIAEVVGSSAGAVRAQAYRGLSRLREVLAERAGEAPSGAGLSETVRSGVARARRRRLAAAGGVALAVLVAVLAVVIPMLRPAPGAPPVGPSPSASLSIELTRVQLSQPVFPYTFGYRPPGAGGPVYVTLIDGQPGLTYAGGPLTVELTVEPYVWDWEAANTSQTTVNGLPATLRTGPPIEGIPRVLGVTWFQDGRWITVEGSFADPVDETLRFANSIGPGGTSTTVSDGIWGLASVLLPTGWAIHEWGQDYMCALPVPTISDTLRGGLCFVVVPGSPGYGGNFTQLTVDGLPAELFLQALVVHRSDGRTVAIEWNIDGAAPLRAEELIALYRGLQFAQPSS